MARLPVYDASGPLGGSVPEASSGATTSAVAAALGGIADTGRGLVEQRRRQQDAMDLEMARIGERRKAMEDSAELLRVESNLGLAMDTILREESDRDDAPPSTLSSRVMARFDARSVELGGEIAGRLSSAALPKLEQVSLGLRNRLESKSLAAEHVARHDSALAALDDSMLAMIQNAALSPEQTENLSEAALSAIKAMPGISETDRSKMAARYAPMIYMAGFNARMADGDLDAATAMIGEQAPLGTNISAMQSAVKAEKDRRKREAEQAARRAKAERAARVGMVRDMVQERKAMIEAGFLPDDAGELAALVYASGDRGLVNRFEGLVKAGDAVNRVAAMDATEVEQAIADARSKVTTPEEFSLLSVMEKAGSAHIRRIEDDPLAVAEAAGIVIPLEPLNWDGDTAGQIADNLGAQLAERQAAAKVAEVRYNRPVGAFRKQEAAALANAWLQGDQQFQMAVLQALNNPELGDDFRTETLTQMMGVRPEIATLADLMDKDAGTALAALQGSARREKLPQLLPTPKAVADIVDAEYGEAFLGDSRGEYRAAVTKTAVDVYMAEATSTTFDEAVFKRSLHRVVGGEPVSRRVPDRTGWFGGTERVKFFLPRGVRESDFEHVFDVLTDDDIHDGDSGPYRLTASGPQRVTADELRGAAPVAVGDGLYKMQFLEGTAGRVTVVDKDGRPWEFDWNAWSHLMMRDKPKGTPQIGFESYARAVTKGTAP